MKFSMKDFLLHESTVDSDLGEIVYGISQICIKIDKIIKNNFMSDDLSEDMSTLNPNGDNQKKIDIVANDLIMNFNWNNSLRYIISEEIEDVLEINQSALKKKYILYVDPLDGSGNFGLNASIGTIFGIARDDGRDILQKGEHQLLAGYCIYGPQTLIILSLKNSVYMFVMKDDNFFLVRENIKVPVERKEFAINMSNMSYWPTEISEYIKDRIQEGYNMRWMGSMVADIHRILLRGGIFLYPNDVRYPEKKGKLRLLYEINPMSFIMERAGGSSYIENSNALQVEPKAIHECCSIFLGSKKEVEKVLKYYQKKEDRTVECIKLGSTLSRMAGPPYPGELGVYIYNNVSQRAWESWIKHQTMLLNENRLSLINKSTKEFLTSKMKEYLNIKI